ncbi:N-acetylmuramoyl-L-alanine amidase [Viridibacillus sp. NPDC096237]|uniref:N-acetylmuramoyl-L-alanine amidase n=1 Tax=Viridibacillus sp. NPDC096237 TaxID=3390721 RepID=UPI003D015951
MVNIRKNLVSQSIINTVTSGTGNGRKWITIHETDNENTTANADAHGRLQAGGNSRSASWHYTVDEKEAVQSFNHNIKCWAAGDGSGNGNANSIHIEICVNKDGNYKKAVENAAALAKKIMEAENIPLDRVVQHNHWSGKNCPSKIRSGKAGVTWAGFKDILKEVTTVSKPENPSTSNNYYTSNPGKIKVIKTCWQYKGTNFVEGNRVQKVAAGPIEYTVKKIEHTKAGTPRLLMKNGTYMTTNKKYVKKA